MNDLLPMFAYRSRSQLKHSHLQLLQGRWWRYVIINAVLAVLPVVTRSVEHDISSVCVFQAHAHTNVFDGSLNHAVVFLSPKPGERRTSRKPCGPCLTCLKAFQELLRPKSSSRLYRRLRLLRRHQDIAMSLENLPFVLFSLRR